MTTWDDHVEDGRRDAAHAETFYITPPSSHADDDSLTRAVARGYIPLLDGTGQTLGLIGGPPVRVDGRLRFPFLPMPLRWEGDDS